MPLVSVCIPTYNTARYLEQAIKSVLAQDYTDFELVICDNASTDETPEICRKYTDPRVRYVRSEALTNQSGNFNRCLDEAKGRLITILHSDDCFLNGFLADRIRRFEIDPELGFVFGAVEIINATGSQISTNRKWNEDRVFPPAALLDELVMGCLISPPSLMVRKSLVDRVGRFRPDLTWGHDWEWSIRLAEQGKAEYSSQSLAAYRVHDASGTAEVLNAAKNGSQERKILGEVLETSSSTTRRRAHKALGRRQMYFAEQSLLAGRAHVARNNLWFAFLADPTLLFRPTFWAVLFGAVGSKRAYEKYKSLRENLPVGVK